MVYLLALLSIMLGSVAQLLLKMSVSGGSFSLSLPALCRLVLDWRFAGGALCYLLSLLFWLGVLSRLELSKAYPMVALGYVFAFVLGWMVLDEPLKPLRILGLVLISMGVIVISRS
ncbi:MAG: EamA family transporter [Muribaculaceae bacterium]|nr:EamA family transporter [Muribaculaceae bacterium]